YYFKDTSGFKRFVLQFISLGIALFFFITFYNAFRTVEVWTIFKYIRKTFLISFIIVSIYSILEIAILKFGLRFLTQTLYLFDYFPFTESWLDYKNYRISSVTFEPPALATYLFTIAPWMLSYILTHKNLLKYLPAILVFIFTFFSGSRAGIFIIVIQYFLFFIALINFSVWQKYVVKAFLFILVAGGILVLLNGKTITNYILEKATSFALDDEDHTYSNRSRLGIVYANFQVFKHNPISGVGLGQQVFEAEDFYPAWAVKGNYEFEDKYLNPKVKSFPPGYNLYVRLLAESGSIGFLLFLMLIGVALFLCIKPILEKDGQALLYMICLISIVGMLLNWLKMDTFRVFTFWFTLAFLIMLTKHKTLVYRK
ncbi:MAG: O-antigen ligase family protein, partial [Psychroflexus sp.]|nr:O-antigen ligase family protein [Psychroflexus sp.]